MFYLENKSNLETFKFRKSKNTDIRMVDGNDDF